MSHFLHHTNGLAIRDRAFVMGCGRCHASRLYPDYSAGTIAQSGRFEQSHKCSVYGTYPHKLIATAEIAASAEHEKLLWAARYQPTHKLF